ncbi:MAG: selenium-dependent molybdenum cofactor biosynthesis protein YqeB [Candidatus Acetothermia bacterium]|jgi:xanthine dehydrogenase accessory factor|nr:selenium-dependent molybdenum cofactor biosynthesis protein YqeB [Candidatus Acetothermia bacterium]MDH7504653.1 selenium-dependent molybdenum cofactor biosynthesis protein YqeB [Candidatus Acetothermia bacterium]
MAVREIFKDIWVLVRGGGELASGAIRRLNWAGFPTVVLELEKPLAVRRLVSFAQCVFAGECEVEGVPGKLVRDLAEARSYSMEVGGVPVLIDPEGRSLQELKPAVLIDGRMAKRPLDTRIGQAPIVIALGPGIEAGFHADAVIETKDGPQDGRVIYRGRAVEDTGVPCKSYGYREERALRAPIAGVFRAAHEIGDKVQAGEVVGWVDDEPVRAKISGVIRGLLYSGLEVEEGTKLGDVDHRGEASDCCRTSEKADSVACGVLEAIFTLGLERGLFARAALASHAR